MPTSSFYPSFPTPYPRAVSFIIAVLQEAAACGQQHTKHSLAKELLFSSSWLKVGK